MNLPQFETIDVFGTKSFLYEGWSITIDNYNHVAIRSPDAGSLNPFLLSFKSSGLEVFPYGDVKSSGVIPWQVLQAIMDARAYVEANPR
jgi:hypothetical protein